jgi:hypothetical protein
VLFFVYGFLKEERKPAETCGSRRIKGKVEAKCWSVDDHGFSDARALERSSFNCFLKTIILVSYAMSPPVRLLLLFIDVHNSMQSRDISNVGSDPADPVSEGSLV